MEDLFFIQGSSIKPYELYFFDKDGELKALCKCPAGKNRRLCKHVRAFLSGNLTNLVDYEVEKVNEVLSFFQQSKVKELFDELDRYELIKKEEKKFFKAVKNKRRKELPKDLVIETLQDDGYLRSEFDSDFQVFDKEFNYIGSVKLPNSLITVHEKDLDLDDLITVQKNVRINGYTTTINFTFLDNSYPAEILDYPWNERTIKQRINSLLLRWE